MEAIRHYFIIALSLHLLVSSTFLVCRFIINDKKQKQMSLFLAVAIIFFTVNAFSVVVWVTWDFGQKLIIKVNDPLTSFKPI